MRGQREAWRRLPQVDRLLREPRLHGAAARLGAAPLRSLVRQALQSLRQAIRQGRLGEKDLERRIAALPEDLAREADGRARSTLRPVINATGVLLHTNLGRAPLSAAAMDRVRQVATSYSTLEYDLAGRRRGSRSSHLERILGLLFPGTACHVANNNAAALTLALHALASGREAIVSRGELVEIGGSFRVPEILAASGARLREVGTTNRTRLADYERAIGRDTGVVLKVHPSNYRVVGFTAEVKVRDLAALARRRRIPLVVDQGSGLLLSLAQFGISEEPIVGDFLRQGADLVTFSGDKLLGGPQAGIIVGRRPLVQRLRRDPLSRALRVDKMTIAALETTLESFLRGAAFDEVPILRLLSRPAADLRRRAEALARGVREAPGVRLEVAVEKGAARVGGGAAPAETLASWCLGLRQLGCAESTGTTTSRASAGPRLTDLERALRLGEPPVIGRLGRDWLWLDMRSVHEGEDAALLEAIRRASGIPA
jgi:L-seryl-tRNA(Ser) seleniumtransferase